MAEKFEQSTGFSIDAIRNLEAEGFARTRVHGDSITRLATALEAVSIAMQKHCAIRSIDSQQGLTAAARNLNALLNGEVAD